MQASYFVEVVGTVLKEVEDSLGLLRAIHRTIDAMVADMADEEWLQKPAPNMNNIASIMEHIILVERRLLSVLAGDPQTIDTQAPFHADHWDVPAIRRQWGESLTFAEAAVTSLTVTDLDAPGLKLGVGELDKRQLFAYVSSHTAHHRGQIPIVKKMLAG